MMEQPISARRAKRKNLGLAETNGNINGDGDKSGNVVEMNGAVGPTTTAKRKRDADEAELEGALAIKKTQTIKTVSTPQETVVVDDTEEGAIEID